MKFEIKNLKWVVFCLLLFPSIGNAAHGYRLVCDEPMYNFGRVDQSAVVTHVFTVRNDGDRTFVLKYIHPGCSCTKARMKPRTIGPNETAKVTAVFKAKRRRGAQRKSIKFYPIDSKSPALTLYMQGVVDKPFGSR